MCWHKTGSKLNIHWWFPVNLGHMHLMSCDQPIQIMLFKYLTLWDNVHYVMRRGNSIRWHVYDGNKLLKYIITYLPSHPFLHFFPPICLSRNRTGKAQAITSSGWFFSERSPYITRPLICVKGGKTESVGCTCLSPVSLRVIFVFLWILLVSSKFVMIEYDTCNQKHKHYR